MLRNLTTCMHLYTVAIAVCIVLLATPVYALNLLPQQLYSLTVNPTYPGPHSTYTVSVTGPAFDISRGAITWFVDGEARSEFSGARSITLRTGDLGTTDRIRVNFTADGAPSTLESTVVAQSVDIVVEGATLTPHFYEGRSLPSNGSGVRFVAIPHLYTVSGVNVGSRDLLYRWSVNDRIVLEGRGADVLNTTMPLSGDMQVTLTIENAAGTVSYKTSLSLEPTTPLVRFYEENPLYGLARNSIQDYLTHTEDEVTVRAEPYFVSRDILTNAQYAWTLNQESVTHAANNPQSLTLSRVGGGGEAEVGFSIRNLNSLLQYAAGLFTISFTDNE